MGYATSTAAGRCIRPVPNVDSEVGHWREPAGEKVSGGANAASGLWLRSTPSRLFMSGIVEESLGHRQVPIRGEGCPIVWTQTWLHGVAGPVRGFSRRPARSASRKGRWSPAGRAKPADRVPVGRRGGRRRDERSGCRVGPIDYPGSSANTSSSDRASRTRRLQAMRNTGDKPRLTANRLMAAANLPRPRVCVAESGTVSPQIAPDA